MNADLTNWLYVEYVAEHCFHYQTKVFKSSVFFSPVLVLDVLLLINGNLAESRQIDDVR